MMPVRLGAVAYLNARPLVYGLDRSPHFDLRFDLPSQCADLLHVGAIDVGTIPAIEYLRSGALGGPGYRVVPDLAIASSGRVASVALFTTRSISDVRSIAIDTSSRTSVALVQVLCAKQFRIAPRLEHLSPDLASMLLQCDAALVIGDNALFAEDHVEDEPAGRQWQRIDLGEAWSILTGLPFVWAFWAGRPGAINSDRIAELRRARDEGVRRAREIAEASFPGSPDRQRVGAQYLRDNIKYDLGPDERAGLALFYQYALETGVVERVVDLSFYEDGSR